MAVERLRPGELFERLGAGADLLLLDVREPEEVAICRIEGSHHVPMGEVLEHARVEGGPLDPERPVVCICHHGIRSARVAGLLVQLGFSEVYNLEGGVEAWALEVDPHMARY